MAEYRRSVAWLAVLASRLGHSTQGRMLTEAGRTVQASLARLAWPYTETWYRRPVFPKLGDGRNIRKTAQCPEEVYLFWPLHAKQGMEHRATNQRNDAAGYKA